MTRPVGRPAPRLAAVCIAALAVGAAAAVVPTGAAAGGKLRVVVSSDFPPLDVCPRNCSPERTSDPDDLQSMVRFLLYTNHFDVEGLIASAGSNANVANAGNMRAVLAKYDLVDENLRKHDPAYPTAAALTAVVHQGRQGTWGNQGDNVGPGLDSDASDALIAIVDKPDPRPVYIGIWGDASNVAQAIWKVQNTRTPAQLEAFLSKMRIYQIAHQDGSIDWLLKTFPSLHIIYSKDTFVGMFGVDDLAWVNANVREGHGPLGAVYPPEGMAVKGVQEGDTGSFLFLVSGVLGKSDPEDPTQPSWGGQFRKDGSTNHYLDAGGPGTISRWKGEFQADFAKRASWMVG